MALTAMLVEVTCFVSLQNSDNITPSDKYSIVIETHMHTYLSFPKCPEGVLPFDNK